MRMYLCVSVMLLVQEMSQAYYSYYCVHCDPLTMLCHIISLFAWPHARHLHVQLLTFGSHTHNVKWWPDQGPFQSITPSSSGDSHRDSERKLRYFVSSLLTRRSWDCVNRKFS